MSPLLQDLQGAIGAGDASRVKSVATQVLAALAPSGLLLDLAEQQELRAELDANAAELDGELLALRHLDEESLRSRLEYDFARAVPILCDAAVPIESWAIPILASLAGPAAAPLLSFGLLIAVKVALAALRAWAEHRVAAEKKEGLA